MHNTMLYIMTYHTLRMHAFHGVDNEAPHQHLLICDVIWTMKYALYDDAKIEQLITTLRDHGSL